ncbi:hypothetical protein PO909_021053 [Leuciscus waleckii]
MQVCNALMWCVSVSSRCVIQVDSVQRWMEDLRHMTEVECMCVLQSKPLGVDEDAPGELIVSVGEQVTRDNLQALLKRALVVSTELGKMFQRLEKRRWQRVHSTALRVSAHVRSLIQEYSTARSAPADMQKYEKSLLEKCMELNVITERCLHTEDEYFLKSMKEAIHEILTDVSDSFSHMIDMALANEIQFLGSSSVCSSILHGCASGLLVSGYTCSDPLAPPPATEHRGLLTSRAPPWLLPPSTPPGTVVLTAPPGSLVPLALPCSVIALPMPWTSAFPPASPPLWHFESHLLRLSPPAPWLCLGLQDLQHRPVSVSPQLRSDP